MHIIQQNNLLKGTKFYFAYFAFLLIYRQMHKRSHKFEVKTHLSNIK